MSVGESLLVGVFGMSVVFIVLLGLSQLLRLQSALINRFTKKKTATSAWDGMESEAASLNSVMETPYTEVLEPELEIIESPGPGSIKEIKVYVGQRVKQGDVLVLLDTLNMEYEIEAKKEGVITQILISKGASVTCGTPLVEIL